MNDVVTIKGTTRREMRQRLAEAALAMIDNPNTADADKVRAMRELNRLIKKKPGTALQRNKWRKARATRMANAKERSVTELIQ